MEFKNIYVTPDGRDTGTGTFDSPLDFLTAFCNSNVVTAGTIVWVATGEYETGLAISRVTGETEAPIIFRAIPGNRAIIKGTLVIETNNIWLWGLEIESPWDGIIIGEIENAKVINCIVHDSGPALKPPISIIPIRNLHNLPNPAGTGIKSFAGGTNQEIYGNIIYDNGWSALDHGISAVNTSVNGTKRIANNILFHNAGANIHCWQEESNMLSGLLIENNISFAASLDSIAETPIPDDVKACILVGSKTVAPNPALPMENVVIRNNCTYQPKGIGRHTMRIGGYPGAAHKGITIENNYVMGGYETLKMYPVADAQISRNTFWSSGIGSAVGKVAISTATKEQLGETKATDVIFNQNTHIGIADKSELLTVNPSALTETIEPAINGKPTGLYIHTKINEYDLDRLHLAIYNWNSEPTVVVDLVEFLKEGETFQVYNVLDLFGHPVAEGIAKNSQIAIPMNGHIYEPEFGAYIIIKQSEPIKEGTPIEEGLGSVK